MGMWALPACALIVASSRAASMGSEQPRPNLNPNPNPPTPPQLLDAQAELPAFDDDLVLELRLGGISVGRLLDFASIGLVIHGARNCLRLEIKREGKAGVGTTVVCPYAIQTEMFKGVPLLQAGTGSTGAGPPLVPFFLLVGP